MAILIWIIVSLILVVLMLDRLIARMYRNARRPHQATPAEHDIAYQEIRIPVSKQEYLYGWWIPATPRAPTILLIHGWGRNLARMISTIAHIHPLGYNLLAFDARNHGSSSAVPHPTVGTFSQDTLAALHFIAESGKIARKDFGLIGLSIGGGAAINAASADNRIKSVITVGALAHPVNYMELEFRKRHVPKFI